MDLQGPSQPSQQTSYNQPSNPSSQTTSEKSQTHGTFSADPPIDHRNLSDVPSTHEADATPSSLGRGDTGPLIARGISASDAQNYSSVPELEGEQMRAPGEGDVAAAVTEKKFGGHGEEQALTENMEEKSKAHKEALHEKGQRTGAEIEEEGKEDWTGKKGEVDVGEALRGRGTAVVLAAED
jgi:hypothetical protein